MMKKLLTLCIASLLVMTSGVLLLFALLHTRYLTPCAQWFVNQRWPQTLTFHQLEYTYPLHFRFINPTLYLSSNPFHAQQVDIWLNPGLRKQGQWQIDSLLIDGANLSSGLPSYQWPKQWALHQLAVRNIDYVHHDWIIRGLSGQIEQPQWPATTNSLPYGKLQLSAEQVYWQGEALSQLLIDADHRAQQSTIYGFSFAWRQALFSGQAEQYPQGWSLVNATINRLNITPNSPLPPLAWRQLIEKHLFHINSLDVLNSDIQQGDVTLNNVSFSLENLLLTPSWWQQENGYLSLNADSLLWQNQQWNEPTFKLELTPKKITITEFTADWLDGHVQFNGFVTPDELYLHRLAISRSRWIQEQIGQFSLPSHALSALKNLHIEQLNLNNLQLIQLADSPHWQLSGFNAAGQGLELKRHGRWGLWNGQLTLSANNASIEQTLTSQAIVEVSSHNGLGHITRAFFPLEQGYLDATASWDATTASAPWQLQLHADGLPLQLFNHWVPLPLNVDALAEFTVTAQGLAGDYPMFSHSLTGQLNGYLRQGTFTYQHHDTLVVQPFESDAIQLTADRGRLQLPPITLSGPKLNAKLDGKMDLLTPDQAMLELHLWQDCTEHHFDLLRDQQATQVNAPCRSTENPSAR
ncbi:AsmA family protein [Vibrio metschnikovii]|uniref:AsmA family protein n=2 Tax=Gammaproteobacteria TaxID=1236 RepID=UPI0020C70758|nr:AsmA family protein [Vibrio metschnikovii]